MFKISRISVQKNNTSRYNIFLTDGKKETYGFSVDEDILVSHRLHKGQELDETTVASLKKQDNLSKSYQLAIHYLSYRMRTTKEIEDYLNKKEVNFEHIAPVINRLKQEGLLNDLMFAESYVRTKMKTSTKGPLLLKKELIQKGITEAEAEEALKEYPKEIQTNHAFKWAQKSFARSGKRSYKMELNRIKAGLMRKGFPQHIINEAMMLLSEEQDKESEWDALVYQGEKLWKKHERKFSGYELKNKVKEGLYRKGFSFDMIQQFVDTYENHDEP
ncbi:MAG TPA: recombination regulator RecX [Cerasibacillus sp.]|uniref:recombination regulator RecX n=1 Tax=Cerasibacillus sp. TaxID=2498711 RepID=UPI002F419200